MKLESAEEEFRASYNEFVEWLADNINESHWECARHSFRHLTPYDAFLEFTLMDALDESEEVPQALATALSWVWASARHSTILRFVSGRMEAKGNEADAKGNHFLAHYYRLMKVRQASVCLFFCADPR